MTLIPSSRALSKLLSEYNHSAEMKIFDLGHMMRIGILFPWACIFTGVYVNLLEMKFASGTQTVALLGIGISIGVMLAAYLTGCIYASIRAPMWAHALLYWLELNEKQLSDNECMLLVPAVKRSVELVRNSKTFSQGKAATSERIINRGHAEEQRLSREYVRSEILRLAREVCAVTEKYLTDSDKSPAIEALHTSAEAAVTTLKKT